jgi:ubiquinone biosynthesis O-methyltransferase
VADPRSTFAGLRVLDVGCGAGLLTEPLARLGAAAVGVDATGPNLDAARWHASLDPTLGDVEYHHDTVESFASHPAHAGCYDAVCALEIVEHLAPGSLHSFIRGCAACLRPGGVLVVSTINRTALSYALAIVAAEQVLNWVEPGTHQWDKFVTVDECAAAMVACGLQPRVGDVANGGSMMATGMVYGPLSGEWLLSEDTNVNYICSGIKSE